MIIPSFEEIPVVDKEGRFTDEWRNIMQVLLQNLQRNAGEEGLVAPTLSSANGSVDPPTAGGQVTQVQNNVIMLDGNTIYTCQFGTIIYDSNTNQMKMAIDNGAGAPIFKVVTLV